MCHNNGGVNIVNQKPENAKISTRANSEHYLLIFWRIRKRHFDWRKQTRSVVAAKNDRERLGNGKMNKWNTQFPSESFQRETETTFQKFLSVSQKFFSGTSQKIVFCVQTNWNFRKSFVNGKQPALLNNISGLFHPPFLLHNKDKILYNKIEELTSFKAWTERT